MNIIDSETGTEKTSPSEEKTATKLLKQLLEVTEQVNDNSLMQNGIAIGWGQIHIMARLISLERSRQRGQHSSRAKTIWKKNQSFSLILKNNKISSSILKHIFKWLTRSWSTFDSSWSYRIMSKTISFIMCTVYFAKVQRTFLNKNGFQKRMVTVIIDFSSSPVPKIFDKVIWKLASLHSLFYLP